MGDFTVWRFPFTQINEYLDEQTALSLLGSKDIETRVGRLYGGAGKYGSFQNAGDAADRL